MKKDVRKLTLVSLFTAIIFLITRFVQIPIPFGYATVSNSVIVLCSMLIEREYGVIAVAIGSSLADFVSFPIYTLPTLLIKGLMPVVFNMVTKLPLKNSYIKYLIAGCVSMLIPLAGYTITGCIIYGTASGLTQLPGLILEYVVNVCLCVALINAGLRLKKSFYRN